MAIHAIQKSTNKEATSPTYPKHANHASAMQHIRRVPGVRIYLGVDTDRALGWRTRPDGVHSLVAAPTVAPRRYCGACQAGLRCGPHFWHRCSLCLSAFFAARVQYKARMLGFSLHIVVGAVHEQILLELAFCVTVFPRVLHLIG